MASRRLWLVSCAASAATAALLGAGCEQRVVGIKNSYVNQDWQVVQEPSPRERGGTDPARMVGDSLDGVGNLLFGWMGRDEPRRIQLGPSRDPSRLERMGPTVQNSGGGSVGP